MATKELAVKFTAVGFEDLRRQLSSVTKSFDETFQKAIKGSQDAIAASKAAAGDTNALAQAQKDFEKAARQANAAIAGSFRELRIKSTADIEAQKAAAISAFEAIKKSGTVSSQDLKNAQAALEQKLKTLDAQLDQTGKKAISAGEGFTIMKGAIANVVSSTVIGSFQKLVGLLQGLTGNVISVGAQAEKTAVAFETFLGSAEKAKTVMEDVRKFAATTPFELPEVTEAAKQLLATKTPADQLIPTIKMLGEIAAGADKPLSQLLFVYTQIKNQGRALGQDINQLLNAGLSMADIAKALGKTEQELGAAKASSKGLQLSFEEVDKVLKSVTSEGGRFYGLMDKLGSTTAVKLSNLNDAFTKIYQSIYDGISPAIAGVLDLIVKTLDPLGENKAIWKDVNAQALEFKKYLDQNPRLAKELNTALTEGVKVALSTASDLAKGILGYLQKNPTAIADAVKQMGFLIQGMAKFTQLIGTSISGWQKIVDLMQQAAGIPTGKGSALDVTRETIRQSLGNKGVEVFDKAWAEQSPLAKMIPQSRDALMQEIAQQIMANPRKYGIIPGQQQTTAPSSDAIVAKTGGALSQDPQTRGRSTGPHLHAQAKGEQMTEAQLRNLVDKYLDLNGKSASDYGTSRGSAGHGYLAIDFTTPQGTPIKLKNGATIKQFGPAGGRGGLMAVVITPEGRFQLGHLSELNPSGMATAKTPPVANLAASTPNKSATLSDEDRKLLTQLALAEAEGEGVAGQAAVIRSVLNRKALIDSGTAKASDYAAKSSSLKDLITAYHVVRGKKVYQYSPLGDGRFDKKFLPSQYAQADKALDYAMDDRSLELLGLSPTAIASPNFQVASLGRGGFWKGGTAQVGNHLFGGDRFSLARNMSELFAKQFTVEANQKTQLNAEKEAKGLTGDFEKEQQEVERIQQKAFDAQTTRQKQRQKAELDNLKNDKDRQIARLKLQGATDDEIKKTEQLLSLNIQLKELEQARAILVAKRTEKTRQMKGGAKNVDPYDYSFDISQLDRQKAYLKEISGLNAALLSEQEKQAILERTFQKQSEARQKDQKSRLEAFRQETELEVGRMRLANKAEEEIAKYQAEREQKLKLQENAFGMENLRIEKAEQDRKKRLGLKTDNRDFDPDINALVRDRRFLENQYQINQAIADQKRGYNVLPGQTDLGLGRINLVPFGQSSPTSPEAMGNPLLETLKPSTSFLSDSGIFSEVRESWIKTLESVFGELAAAIAKSSGVGEMLQVDYGSRLPTGFGSQAPDLSGDIVLSRQDQIAQIRSQLELIDRQQVLNQAQQNEEAIKQNEILKARLELEQRILEIQDQQTQGKLTAEEAQQRIDLEKSITDERLKQLDSTKSLGEAIAEVGQGAFAKFFQDTITGTQSVSDAFKSMAQSILSTISNMVAQMATVEVFKLLGLPTKGGDSLPSIGSLFGNLFGGGGSGDRGGNAPSISPFNAQNANSAFNPISGFSGILSGLLGFADGGFTGYGGKYEPKGIVHGGEFVLNSFATRNLGVDLLEKVNSTGSLPTLAMPVNLGSSAVSSNGKAGNTITINNNYPEASQRFLTQSRTLAREQAEAISRAMK